MALLHDDVRLPPSWSRVDRAISASERLQSDFAAICAFGGRFAGSDGERAATAWLKARLTEDFGRPPEVYRLPHDGWQRVSQRLECLEPGGGELPCLSLVWSPATPASGLEAEVVDLGRGTPEEIRARADEVRGRIALVRHEYMFWPGTVHRRLKYEAAREAGAAGFLIANRIPGDLLVTGSSGRGRPDDIPAAGTTLEAAEALAATGVAHPRVRLTIRTGSQPTHAECLFMDLPGRGPDRVAVSAHIDGHPLAESAMDNATGLAAVMEIGRAMAPVMSDLEHGLRLCLFNLEEWGVAGSAVWLDEMAPEQRDAFVLDVNLDCIAGDPRLTALTSGFARLEPWLTGIAARLGMDLGTYRPLMANSDHYHFARHGIPALRLVAGFDDQDSTLRYVITPEDRHERVPAAQLREATRLAAAIALTACATPALDLRD